MFPYQPPAIRGAITPPEDVAAVSGDGVVIYLKANPSLDAAFARVSTASGTVVPGRTDLPPGMGCFAKISVVVQFESGFQ